jgi:hypothetical protein
MYDLAAHRHAWWAPGKCLELRRRLAPMVAHPNASRDVQLLDIALESWLRLLVERTDRCVEGASGFAPNRLHWVTPIVGAFSWLLPSVYLMRG